MDRLEIYKQRFLAKTIKTPSCWNWNGAKISGYGCFFLDGKRQRAHRASYQLFIGTIPDCQHLAIMGRDNIVQN